MKRQLRTMWEQLIIDVELCEAKYAISVSKYDSAGNILEAKCGLCDGRLMRIQKFMDNKVLLGYTFHCDECSRTEAMPSREYCTLHRKEREDIRKLLIKKTDT
ncbi:MAG: hypothetical protein V1915_02030 [Candidatus Bathyarchaeota archaeon]